MHCRDAIVCTKRSVRSPSSSICWEFKTQDHHTLLFLFHCYTFQLLHQGIAIPLVRIYSGRKFRSEQWDSFNSQFKRWVELVNFIWVFQWKVKTFSFCLFFFVSNQSSKSSKKLSCWENFDRLWSAWSHSINSHEEVNKLNFIDIRMHFETRLEWERNCFSLFRENMKKKTKDFNGWKELKTEG